MMEKLFKLSKYGTNVRTEIIAGLTTFMTMAYIIALNPNILTFYTEQGGQELWNAVFLATCLASGIAMICMAFIANKPIGLAPGMGLNAFYAATVLGLTSAGVSYVAGFQAMLLIILAEGIIFLVLTLCNVREAIVHAIPRAIRHGIAPGIGMLLLNIGFGSNIYLANSEGAQFFIMKDFFGALTGISASMTMGDAYPKTVLSVATMLIGLFVIIFLARKKVTASVILGMFVASVIYWIGDFVILQENPFAAFSDASWIPAFGDMANLTFCKFNFEALAQIGWLTVITLLITFVMIDMFDTIGVLIGTAERANLLDENGDMPQMKEAMLCDSIGTIAGALTGTSTVTSYAESTSGAEAGGRTGLTALTCGIMFLACLFIAPIARVIPAPATSAALIYVGVLMLGGLKTIHWDHMEESVPVAILLIGMPVSGSIGNAIGLALISYTVIMLCKGKPKDISILTYVISAIFLLKFFIAF
ncbi:MAG: NCS2 family permease [Coriobacteriales bacterium]|nr:NCS2 family permease [Coriobacteriales bacterium]